MTEEQYEILIQEYLEDFRKEITEDILSWGELDEFESGSEAHYRYYFGDMPWPSAKFYAPWATGGITEVEMERDQAWFEALTKRCDEMVKQIQTLSYMDYANGEGDPTDLFLIWGMMEDDV